MRGKTGGIMRGKISATIIRGKTGGKMRGKIGGLIMRGRKTEVLKHKPVSMPLSLLQIPHGLNWYRTRVSEVTASSKKNY